MHNNTAMETKEQLLKINGDKGTVINIRNSYKLTINYLIEKLALVNSTRIENKRDVVANKSNGISCTISSKSKVSLTASSSSSLVSACTSVDSRLSNEQGPVEVYCPNNSISCNIFQ